MTKLIDRDPLSETEAILSQEFYGRRSSDGTMTQEPLPEKKKPTHYKIVCISLYKEDIERLEGKVAELKQRGHTKANKSALIRYALDTVNINEMPKGY